MSSKSLPVVLILVSVTILILGVVLVSKTNSPELASTGSASLQVVKGASHNWGEIDIDGGNVEKTFQIKSVGESDLEITNVKTSCMCTEAKVTISKKDSPTFGMHSRSGWKGVVKPGETAEVKVVFDPLFHGPQGTGLITRLVSFNTNDANSPTVEFKLTGNVVKK
jgi:hypothetical protein